MLFKISDEKKALKKKQRKEYREKKVKENN